MTSTANAQSHAPLRVAAFEGGWNLPIWVAQEQGLFDVQGLSIDLSYTPGSAPLMTSLCEGNADIAFALFDNVVAYDEGQGEAKLAGGPDFVAFLGGDGGFASVVAAPDVKRFADLKGKTVSVDAMTTGFAFLFRDAIARNGIDESEVTFVRAGGTANRYRQLIEGMHAATLLRTPYDVLARDRGFNILSRAESASHYQGTVGFTRRTWAKAHEAAIVRFIRAYKAAIDWLHNHANRDQVEAMLVANVADLTPALAKQACDLLLGERGLSSDLAFDPEGMQRVLNLRSHYAVPSKTLNDPTKYIDVTYLMQATNAIGGLPPR